MIEIDQAIELVSQNCRQLSGQVYKLEDLPGHVLAEDVISDVDSPPFDKSMMDGFAIRSADFHRGTRSFSIVGRIMAGSQFSDTVQADQAVQIMTGAPIPDGPDAVVMVEQTSESGDGESGDRVTIHADSVVGGQNILARGLAMTAGQSVMSSGSIVRAEDIGVLAEAGATEVRVVGRPSLSVIATGDELVDVSDKPTGSQIRNSNGPMLVALAKPLCSKVANLGIGPDKRDLLGEKIRVGLQSDVLVLSGGVSAGVVDLVPGLLQDAGVEQVFHKVKIKPGKPIWFGLMKRTDEKNTLVFGLPGNPVSSMICFHVFVAPALRRLAGIDPRDFDQTGILTHAHTQRAGRTTYWPSRLTRVENSLQVTALDWKGSADLKTLAHANCLAVFPGDRASFNAGETIRLFPMTSY